MNRFIVIAMLFTCILAPRAAAVAEESYGIFSVISRSTGEKDPALFSEVLAVELKKTVPAGVWIYSWKSIQTMAAKPAVREALTACENDSCLVAFGRSLGVTYLIAVSMDSTGEGCSVLLRLIDLAGARTVRRAHATAAGCTDSLVRNLSVLVRRVLGTDSADAASAQKSDVPPLNSGMVWIPGGTFRMGSADGEADERPVHQVAVSGFYMSRHEVTQAQYRRVMGGSPSQFAGCPDCPVERVSWKDAREYCRITGTRLPTEAEWEYACRAGSTTKFFWGDTADDSYAWYRTSADSATRPVGGKKPNAFGLYDMAGNVWEWCSDWYGRYAANEAMDPTGPGDGTCRVIRGGSSGYPASRARSANRSYDSQEARRNIGFRVVKSSP